MLFSKYYFQINNQINVNKNMCFGFEFNINIKYFNSIYGLLLNVDKNQLK
jgi:hypothetical protein